MTTQTNNKKEFIKLIGNLAILIWDLIKIVFKLTKNIMVTTWNFVCKHRFNISIIALFICSAFILGLIGFATFDYVISKGIIAMVAFWITFIGFLISFFFVTRGKGDK